MGDIGLNHGRRELLGWLNEFLETDYAKIEQVAGGSAYCQIIDALHPGVVPISRVKFDATTEYDRLCNYQILDKAFKAAKINKFVDVNRLAKGRFQDSIEFLEWIKGYYDDHGRGVVYDAKAVRDKYVKKRPITVGKENTSPARVATTQDTKKVPTTVKGLPPPARVAPKRIAKRTKVITKKPAEAVQHKPAEEKKEREEDEEREPEEENEEPEEEEKEEQKDIDAIHHQQQEPASPSPLTRRVDSGVFLAPSPRKHPAWDVDKTPTKIPSPRRVVLANSANRDEAKKAKIVPTKEHPTPSKIPYPKGTLVHVSPRCGITDIIEASQESKHESPIAPLSFDGCVEEEEERKPVEDKEEETKEGEQSNLPQQDRVRRRGQDYIGVVGGLISDVEHMCQTLDRIESLCMEADADSLPLISKVMAVLHS